MKRRHAPQYRHTAFFCEGEHEGAWSGDVTLIYSVYWGCRATCSSPAEGAAISDWRVVAIDRSPVGPVQADPAILKLVEDRIGEITDELIRAAEDADDYAEESYQDARREELRTTGVLW